VIALILLLWVTLHRIMGSIGELVLKDTLLEFVFNFSTESHHQWVCFEQCHVDWSALLGLLSTIVGVSRVTWMCANLTPQFVVLQLVEFDVQVVVSDLSLFFECLDYYVGI